MPRFVRNLTAALLLSASAAAITACRSAGPVVEAFGTPGAPRTAGGDPITVMQISDLHLRSEDRRYRRVAALVARVRPDILVITGDSVESPAGLPLLEDFLRSLTGFRMGFAVPGNWEYGGGVTRDALERAYARGGVAYMVNASVDLAIRGRTIRVTALDDQLWGRPDWSLVEGSLDYPEIVLAHEPAAFDVLGDLGSGKTVLAGHTHGGQVTFFGRALYLPPGSAGYVGGLYERGGNRMVVSRGVGTSTLYLRLFARPDVVVLSF